MNLPMFDSYILIKPSTAMCAYITKREQRKNSDKYSDIKFVTSPNDYAYIKSLDDKLNQGDLIQESLLCDVKTFSSKDSQEGYLQLNDLIWLNNELKKERASGKNIYLHELLQNCSIFVPENETIERNPKLELRCTLLKNQQNNQRYKFMTKNVDSVRLQEPQDTISYQLKQINRQLIAVAQFVISVMAGFAFGFIGIELLVGTLDFGFRLLLGIMFALTIALAELYFLAKQLINT